MEILILVIFFLSLIWLGKGKETNTNIGKAAVKGSMWGTKGLLGMFLGVAKYSAKATKNKLEAPSIKFGSARFMNAQEEHVLLNPKHQGLSINGTKEKTLSEENSFKHLVLVAPSGAGKTTSYVLPSILLQLQDGGSIVVTDPSGEIFNQTSEFARRQGYTIKIFDVSNPSQSFCYNPLKHAKSHREIAHLSKVLVESSFAQTNANSFWNDGASTIIEIFIKLLKTQDPRFTNLANVRHLLNGFGVDGKPLLPLFVQPLVDQTLLGEYKGFINQEPKILHGFLSTAKTALKSFSELELSQITAKDNLDFKTIRSKPTILYICCKEALMKHYQFILKILYHQLFTHLMEHLSPNLHPVYVYMDEFGNLGKIDDFNTILTTARKYRVSISVILQDIKQLSSIYGENQASVIMNGGTSSKLFLPGMSAEDCETVEHLLGQTTIEDINFWTQEKQAAYGRVLLTANEVRTMVIGSGLFVHANQYPLKLKMVPFYQNPFLKQQSELPSVNLPKMQLAPLVFLPLPVIKGGNTTSFPAFDL